MAQKTLSAETTAQAYLELLADRGIDYLFANAGTDFAPLIDAFARRAAEGKLTPVPVLVPHENVAVAMAHGYYQVSGKPAAVMVHVNVGTANSLNGIINASRDNIPIIFSAGRTPLMQEGMHGSRDLYIHWAQESFDQAGMLREFVKWDYELRNHRQLEAVVDRALTVAMAEPRGPVYLTLPREVLAEPVDQFTLHAPPPRTVRPSPPDPQAIKDAAALLAAARNPLIITTSSGRNPESVASLVALADLFALPVVTFNPRYLCFPTNHPLHLGFSPAPHIENADVVLVVDSSVPWYPGATRPAEGCKVIEIANDPSYREYPMRSFPCELAIRGDSAAALPLLARELRSYREEAGRRVAERFVRLKELHDNQRAGWREKLVEAGLQTPLDPLWISHCIDAVKDDDTLIFNEYDLDPTQVELTRPGSFFGNPTAGGLGWGLGAAIGAKLAAPKKTVIATLGEGSYLFGNPTPAHFVSRAAGAPTLTVIFNNSVWNAVRLATLRMYPEGWAARTGNLPLTRLEPVPDYEVLVTACGGYGERVESPEEVLPALKRGLKAVREEGRAAVLNMICQRPE